MIRNHAPSLPCFARAPSLQARVHAARHRLLHSNDERLHSCYALVCRWMDDADAYANFLPRDDERAGLRAHILSCSPPPTFQCYVASLIASRRRILLRIPSVRCFINSCAFLKSSGMLTGCGG
jgi:hypothetical protein